MATHEFPAAARHKAAVNGLTLGSWVLKAAKKGEVTAHRLTVGKEIDLGKFEKKNLSEGEDNDLIEVRRFRDMDVQTDLSWLSTESSHVAIGHKRVCIESMDWSGCNVGGSCNYYWDAVCFDSGCRFHRQTLDGDVL